MFNIGDKVVYPMHGAGIIEGIEEKEISSRILESFRIDTLTPEDIAHLNKRIQIRYL